MPHSVLNSRGRNRQHGNELMGANCNDKQEEYARDRTMTAQQYLLSQAEHCRRTAADTADPFVAEELKRLAADFERRANVIRDGKPSTRAA